MWMYGTISESLLNSVGEQNCTARQLWTTLKNLFTKKRKLQRSFNNKKPPPQQLLLYQNNRGGHSNRGRNKRGRRNNKSNNWNSNSQLNGHNHPHCPIALVWPHSPWTNIPNASLSCHTPPVMAPSMPQHSGLAHAALANTSSTIPITHPNMDTSHTVPLTAPQASRPPQHQVFISFRGQLRNNFISHLEGGLRREGINVFIDKNEDKGVPISNLFKRLEESKIAIVVFSSEYTKSTWCLNEAEKIKELATQGKLKVLPIFYKVTPTNVKELKKEFGDYFREQEYKYRKDTSVIQKWKEAIEFITDIHGSKMNDQSDEHSFIASVIEDVLKILKSIP